MCEIICLSRCCLFRSYKDWWRHNNIYIGHYACLRSSIIIHDLSVNNARWGNDKEIKNSFYCYNNNDFSFFTFLEIILQAFLHLSFCLAGNFNLLSERFMVTSFSEYLYNFQNILTNKRSKYIYLDLNVSLQWLYRCFGDLCLCWG